MPDASEATQSVALQVIYPDQSGMFARIARTIGEHGGDLGRIDMLGPSPRLTTRGISVRVRDDQHLARIVAAVRTLDKVKIVNVSEPTASSARPRTTWATKPPAGINRKAAGKRSRKPPLSLRS